MPAKRYRVNLTQDEREQLLDVARRGKSPARKVKRSLILCKADDGLTDQQIADALLVGPSTVVRVRQRFTLPGQWEGLPKAGGRPAKEALAVQVPVGEVERHSLEVYELAAAGGVR